MFVCQGCSRSFGPKVRPNRIVVEQREVTYPYREGANPRDDIDGTDDPGGHGREIVKEVVACDPCMYSKFVSFV